MTRLSNDERRAVIERFYSQVSEGIPIDQQWVRGMVDASAPRLPDEPTPEQVDAWIELSTLLADPTFLASMRTSAAQTWNQSFDFAAYRRANQEGLHLAREALDQGVEPTSPDVAAKVRRFAEALAASQGKQASAAFFVHLRAQMEQHDPRASRYWELVSILKGQCVNQGPFEEWAWLVKALRHHIRA